MNRPLKLLGGGLAALAMSVGGIATVGSAAQAATTTNTGSSDRGPSSYRPPAGLERNSANAQRKVASNLASGKNLLSGVSRSAIGSRTYDKISATEKWLDARRMVVIMDPSANALRRMKALVEKGTVLSIPKIHWEGQGNHNKHYTCGPSSTRNLVQAATGKDPTEHQLEIWEGTTTSGTDIGSIASTLNRHYNLGTFAVTTPSSAKDLAALTETTVYFKHHELIQNVQTYHLNFWHGHPARHYDGIFGADSTRIWVSEEWWPKKIGLSSNYGQPYGRRPVTWKMDYDAVHGSPTGQVVY